MREETYVDISSELRQYLDHHERLHWTGQPKKGILFRSSDIFMIPFSLFWCGFAIFWFIGASQASMLFALFGIPFILAGLILVFGRYFIDAKQRENTFYGITDERIIIKSGIFNKSIKSINLKTLSDIEYVEKKDGSGTISIGPKNPFVAWNSSMNWWPGMKSTPSLDMVQDVRKVYNRIIELQKSL